MSTITREQLIRRAHLTVSRGARELEKHPDRDGVAADIKIASIAARSLMAEPIYQLWDEGYYDTEKETYDAAIKAGGRGRIVYTAAPAPVSVPDERYQHLSELYHAQEKRLFKLAQRIKGSAFDKYAHSPSQAIDVLESALFGESDETCRAAMLQSFGNSEQLNSPVIPDEKGSSLQLRNLIRQRHAEWSQATFGDVGPVGPLKHLSKEALEAAAEPDDLSEWADMQFLLWDAQRRAGISDGEITAAMEEKLKENMARQWPEPKDGEPRLHIKSTPHREDV